MTTALDDEDSEFHPLAGIRLVVTEPIQLLEGDWIEGRNSSIESISLSFAPDSSVVRLHDGQVFAFYNADRLVVYRR